MHTGSRHSRQRSASVSACCSVKPPETSSKSWLRTSAARSFAFWRGILTRAGGLSGLAGIMAGSRVRDTFEVDVGAVATHELVEVHGMGVELGAINARE